MSSQGIAGSSGATGYVYSTRIQDASEWTKVLKEKREYYSYNSTLNTGNRSTQDPWVKTSNAFRMTYNFGQFACQGCTGGAFNGPSTPL